MRIPCEVTAVPLTNTKWWTDHVQHSKFRRQGIDIICASFIQPKTAKANLVLVTGLMESFLKYSEVIQLLYENGFNVFTYDHQSQGLSGRWLTESQSLWVHTFDDYVDDFMYFVTTITKGLPNLPIFVLAHSMGGFIAANAMCRLPALVQRAILLAPMIRNLSGVKALDYRGSLPQTVAYWLAAMNKHLGMGTVHCLGYFKEKPTDRMNINVITSDQEQLDKWMDLRMRYPNIIATCVTNDWIYHSIRAQNKFESKYEFVKTNTLILCAENDYFVNNRGSAMFIKKAPHSKMFFVPGAYHEILFEKELIRNAALKAIFDFFNQKSDDVSLVQPGYPMQYYDPVTPIYSLTELVIRGVGVTLSVGGFIAGLAMLFSDRQTLA